jgi:hypothetical protein
MLKGLAVTLWLCMLGLGGWALRAQTMEEAWSLLQKPDAQLRSEVIATEQILDLVNASVLDSLIGTDKQRLKGLGGWIIQHAAARYWTHYTDAKQKYIGTNSRPYHIYNGVGDEVDVNVFIMPHLPRYVNMVAEGFKVALSRNRSENGFRFDQPDNFPLPTELKYQDRGYLTVECEVTPPQQYAELLEQQFFPTREGSYHLDSLPHFGTKHPSMGMTGVWCMDCNHNCRPEIHPIEWIWWLDLSPERAGSAHSKSWMVALMVDGSNRFNDWRPSPAAGAIDLPFFLPTGAQQLNIRLAKIAADPVLADSADYFVGTGITGDTTMVFQLSENGLPGYPDIQIQLEGNWPAAGLGFYFLDLQAAEGGTRGYLRIAGQVESLLAFRATFDY